MPISFHPIRWLRGALVLWLALLASPGWLRAAELEKAQSLFRKGDYEECLKLVEEVTKTDRGSEEWRILQLQALLVLGRYGDAQQSATNALRRHATSIRVRLAAWDALRQNGRADEARECLEEIASLSSSRFSVRDAQSLVALGRAALMMGNDPKVVLENCYERARKSDPNCRDAYLAAGDLALLKHDDALASKNYQEGLAKFADDPDLLFGLAQAFAEGERAKMLKFLQAALEANPNHLPSRLLLVEHLIDGERYEDAEKELQKVFKVNPSHPEGWAYRAVLAHLTNLPEQEKQARSEALKHWKDNPLIDHLIGKKLSQKYRFVEGAAHQRQALKFDVAYLPAKAQLAVDLLRLGKEEDGWKMVQEVYEKDAYDVNAYNLVTLQDNMAKYVTLTNEHFLVRMIAREAPLYGQRVLALLERARTTLCPKYGWEFEGPVIVEIFAEQKDFGVRTFGMPDNPGYLGVCFGPVITANSPASQAANPSSWEAVLYHEFCHVVTLHLTKNKMPRWLSEGISVFEETQANPAWGQPMTPQYREKILDKGLKPVGELSAAFLTAKSGLDLQFAYYQSSLAVEFLVGRYGLENLKKILLTLGEGEAINAAIAKHTAPLPQIEKEFAAYAKEKAEKLAPGLDWEKPPAADPLQAPPDWLARHANNYYLLTAYAKKLLTDKKWEEAKTPLNKLLELYPANVGGDNAYVLLARAHRGLSDTHAERAVLTEYTKRSADSTAGFERLMELASTAKDWPVVAENVARYLAVNPLTPVPYRYHALASEALGKPELAIEAYRTQLLLDPPNPAEVHFHLAKLLNSKGDPATRRHVLQALEEAPRYREALQLLLQLGPSPEIKEAKALQ